MERLSWFDKVDRRLRAYGLPYGYRCRMMQEFRDHAEEIITRRGEAITDMECLLSRHLGQCEKVATVIKDVYQERYFAGRHPIITFGLLPIPLVMLAVFLGFLGMVGLSDTVGQQWGIAVQISYIGIDCLLSLGL